MKFRRIKIYFIILHLLIAFSIQGQVTFSEVMFDPATNEYYDEFIELYNYGNSSILLKSTALDKPASLIINGSEKKLYSPDNNYLLEAGSRAVILDNGYLVENKSSTYDQVIPDSVLLITIEEASFGLTNDSSNDLFLIHPVSGDTLSAYSTTPDQDEGYSDEKIVLNEENIAENWGNSRNSGGTPGLVNSITPREYDLGFVTGEFTSPERPVLGDTLVAYFEIKNKGKQTVTGAEFQCGLDVNKDSILQSDEINIKNNLTLEPEASYSSDIALPNQNIHQAILIAKIMFPEDQNKADNRKIITADIAYPDTCLVINEIMYDPAQGSDWIEVYNRSMFTINLQNWMIFDAVGYETIPDNKWFLSPKAHIAIVEDSSFLDFWGEETNILSMGGRLPAFNNSGDKVIVRDHTGKTIDSLRYDDSWGGSDGRSLERRNPADSSNSKSNWGTSEAGQGATPGRKNSIMIQEQDAKLIRDSIRTLPENIYKGDSVHTTFIIQNAGLQAISDLGIEARYHQIPDSLNNQAPFISKDYEVELGSGATLKDTLKWQIPAGGTGYLELTLTAPTDRNKQNNKTIVQITAGYPAKSAVINEIMYNPVSGAPEWFEIRNVSQERINLTDWFFKDSQNNLNYITRNIAFLDSGDYVVVTEDMSFLNHYPGFMQKLILAPTFPTLNNNSDSLVIIDAAGNYIDSLFYTSEWGLDKGRSLERQSPRKASGSIANWSLSKAELGATPGAMNSIAMQRYDLAVDSVWTKEGKILAEDTARVKVGLKNTGIEPISDYMILINMYETDSLSKHIYENEIHDTIKIESESSLISQFVIPVISGGVHYYEVSVISNQDQSLGNNSFSGNLNVGYKQSAVVINEIMYDPASGEAEWLELFNTTDKAVNLQNWEFSDATSKWHPVTDTALYLPSQKYVILASNNEFFQTYPDFQGKALVPVSFPSLNNTSEDLVIRDAVDHQIDYIIYRNEWGGDENLSLERKNPYLEALDKSNWGSSQDSIGATPGIDNSILKFDYDLALIKEGFKFNRRNVESGEIVNFEIEVLNNGINYSPKYNLKLYKDADQDSMPAENEKVWELRNIPSLEPDSSRILTGKIFSGNPGKENMILELNAEIDHNPHNNRLYSALNVSYPEKALVINEFLANPAAEQVEFIELYNRSEETINFYEWSLRNSWFRMQIKDDHYLQSGEYLILTGDSAFYDYFGGQDLNLIISEDFPRLTNVSDTLTLQDLAGKTIDSLYYDQSWKIERGKSMEKYLPDYDSDDRDSWSVSTAGIGATPGRFNSISPLKYDLGIDSLIYTAEGDTDDVFLATLVLINEGTETAQNAKLRIADSSGVVIEEIDVPGIVSQQKQEIELEIGPLPRGYNYLEATIDWQADLNKNNNRKNFEIYVSYLPGELIISEFMAIPFTTYREGLSIAEYVEIFNFTDQQVNLQDWSITDANTGENHYIKSGNYVRGKDYFAVADDSTIKNFTTIQENNYSVLPDFPNLNNDSDKIFLKDPRGVVIDSLSYFSGWNLEEGVAQEKVFLENPNLSNNWRSSTAEKGGTPGYENSVQVKNLAKKPGFRAKPEAFSPDGDGVDDRIGFYYRLSFASANVTLTIYDLTGRIIAQPAYRTHSSSEGVIYWNGDSKYGGKARVGRYIARIKAVDTDTKDKEGYITTFVIANRSH